MAEMPNIDPDFEPQARPRSCTWPMKRPNLGGNKDDAQENDISMKLEPTIEEAGSQEQIMAEAIMSPVNALGCIKQENQDGFMSNAFPLNEYGNGLVGSPLANRVTDYSSLIVSPQQQSTIAVGGNGNNLSFTNLDTMPQTKPVPVCNFGAVSLSTSAQSSLDIKPNITIENTSTNSDLQQKLNASSVNNGDSATATSPVVVKPKTSSRKNAWGNMSYADLITQGIESSPDKRLTLAQIYDWMVKNVPYFKDKGDSNSSAGWKNSIRHNLSLHSKFKRIQNEGTGKSSWWVINHDAKPGKSPRRRTTSLDTSNLKTRQSRTKIKQKVDLMKKQKAGKRESPTWARSPTGVDGLSDFDPKPFPNDFRNRTGSNASSIGGRMSPPRPGSFLTQDLEDDGPPPLSPLSSHATTFDLFGRAVDFNLDGLDINTADPLLLDSIASMDVITPSSPMTQCNNNDRTNIYINSMDGTPTGQPQESFTCSSPMYVQQIGNVVGVSTPPQAAGVVNVTTNANRGALSSPNLATLLQQGVSSQQTNAKLQSLTANNCKPNKALDISGSMPRARANTMPRLQPQPKYSIPDNLRRQSGESLSQDTLFTSYNNADTQLSASPQNAYINPQYSFTRPPPQQQVQQQQQRQGQDGQAGLSSLINQNKTLFQLLRTDEIATINQPQQQQQQQINMNMNQRQVNSMPIPNQQQQTQVDGTMPMQNYTQPIQVQSVQLANNDQQQTGNQSNLLQMGQGKYPSDLNLDNKDIFDPGLLDFEQMLQEMDPPTSEGFGMDFNSYFPQESQNFELVDMDNRMDTSNGMGLNNSGREMNKLSDSSDNGYYPNQVGVESIGMQQQQQQQQQRFGQPPMYNMSMADARPFMGMDAPSSGTMVVGGPSGPIGMGGTGLPPHFTHPHHALRPQSSVGSINDYRM